MGRGAREERAGTPPRTRRPIAEDELLDCRTVEEEPEDDPWRLPLDMSLEGILARFGDAYSFAKALAEWRLAIKGTDFDVSSDAVQDIIELSFEAGFVAAIQALDGAEPDEAEE